jgi:hypothetical protein
MTADIKQREIQLDPHHPDPNQAQTAWLFLCHIAGIEHIDVISSTQLVVHYQLSVITLEEIETRLIEHGHTLNTLLQFRIRRAIYHYTDETERANISSQDILSKTTRDVFINQYQQDDHGCRDKRDKYWRDYS